MRNVSAERFVKFLYTYFYIAKMLDKERGGVILIRNKGDKGTSRTVRGKVFLCAVCRKKCGGTWVRTDSESLYTEDKYG